MRRSSPAGSSLRATFRTLSTTLWRRGILCSYAYKRNAALVRANVVSCWICGLPFTDPNDPAVADHVVPRIRGGSDDLSNLRAAHRTCNGRRGQRLGEP